MPRLRENHVKLRQRPRQLDDSLRGLALFRALLDQSNDAIQVIEPGTLRFLDVNDRTCLELGYSRGELLSMTVFDIAPGFDQRQRTTVLEQIKKSGSAMIERVHRRKDGTVFPVEVTLREVHLDRTYGVAVARDITERKRAEQALKESQVTLARVTRIATMGELTATIAHEINQPLAAVSTNASAALRWLAVRPPNLVEAREAMASAMREANRAKCVIDRIRTLLKKSAPALQPLNVNELIRETLALTHSELITGGVAVHTKLSAELPAVLGDRVQLQQVILNLIMNALDALKAIRDAPRKLTIESAKDPEGLLIQVEDSGEGLDPEQVHRIFDPFFTTKPEGIGMGLPISRSIVEAHGGHMWAMPGSPRGAVLRLILPKADTSV